jgi:hypothetical protein
MVKRGERGHIFRLPLLTRLVIRTLLLKLVYLSALLISDSRISTRLNYQEEYTLLHRFESLEGPLRIWRKLQEANDCFYQADNV